MDETDIGGILNQASVDGLQWFQAVKTGVFPQTTVVAPGGVATTGILGTSGTGIIIVLILAIAAIFILPRIL
jgi:hypothetical protein